MQEAKHISEKKASPDFTLILSRMEDEIIQGKNRSVCRRVLGREDIWKSITVEKQFKWARLAQMAGDVETALNVLAHVNHIEPKVVEAWRNRLEMLSVLDRKDEMVSVLGIAKGFIDGEQYQALLGLCSPPNTPEENKDIQSASAPFETLHQRQNAILRYIELFSGREDCFARQWADKKEGKQGYVPVRRPLEHADVDEHLRCRKTYGIYLLKSDSTVNLAVIDADIVEKFRQIKLKADDKHLIRRERHFLISRIKELSEERGLNPLIEFSGGKGFHFWYFFESPVEAGKAKRAIESIKNPLNKDLSAFNLEVFPKQDKLSGKGLGNLVKLPLGVHRLSGKKSYFIECHDRSIEAQLNFLSKIYQTRPEQLTISEKKFSAEKVFVHPRWKKWAQEYPELAKLERLCPPVAQIMATCRHGKNISLREEKVLFQTIGFLPRAKTLVHHLMAFLADYNPHMVDFKLSRLRGTPLGCRRIHSLLSFEGDMCPFDENAEYAHPLLHFGPWESVSSAMAEKAENLGSALDNLNSAISQVRRFLK